jgi:hypothetical protein
MFGGAAEHPDDLDPHFFSYFGAMPIRDLLEFAAPAGGPEPEARIDELLGSLIQERPGSDVREPPDLVGTTST